MSFYDEYKPFRNYMRRFDRTQSLVDVWCYFQHVTDNRPLPQDYAVGRPFGIPIKGRVWPWELDTLAREIVLNAGKGGDRSLRNWKAFADAVDNIKRLDEEAYRADPKVDVLWELPSNCASANSSTDQADRQFHDACRQDIWPIDR
jgi:hypothetical protein